MLMRWWRRQLVAGMALFSVSMMVFGVSLSSAVSGSPLVEQAATTTGVHTEYVTRRQMKVVTVRVRGKVIRRYDHILVVQVPRVVFHTLTHRRIVVPAHVVRIREKHQPTVGPPIVAAVVGVAPPPVTVTVPVTVDVPGPTTTVTLPQATTTVTIPITTTVPTTITVPAESSTTP